MKNAIAVYTVCNTIALAISEICPGGNEVMAALITEGKTPRYTPHIVWCDPDSGRLYINHCRVRYYLDEFMRV